MSQPITQREEKITIQELKADGEFLWVKIDIPDDVGVLSIMTPTEISAIQQSAITEYKEELLKNVEELAKQKGGMVTPKEFSTLISHPTQK